MKLRDSKIIYILLLLTFSFSIQAQDIRTTGYDDKGIWKELPISVELLNELLAQKTKRKFSNTSDIINIQNACIKKHVVDVLFTEIFNIEAEKTEQERTHITVKRKEGKIFSRKKYSVSYVNDYYNHNQIIVYVNNLKYFQSNPYITQNYTTLNMLNFPTVDIEQLEDTIYDDLGNRRTQNKEFMVVGVRYKDKTTGQLNNKYTHERISLEYDYKGLIECYENAFDL